MQGARALPRLGSADAFEHVQDEMECFVIAVRSSEDASLDLDDEAQTLLVGQPRHKGGIELSREQQDALAPAPDVRDDYVVLAFFQQPERIVVRAGCVDAGLELSEKLDQSRVVLRMVVHP